MGDYLDNQNELEKIRNNVPNNPKFIKHKNNIIYCPVPTKPIQFSWIETIKLK